MKRVKSCATCMIGAANNFNDDILCRIKGIVSRDFACSKYKPVPMAKRVNSHRSKCIECEFYIVDAADSVDPVSIGYCQLFTVRKFNGQSKNACSKFMRKSELIVS